jgi:hypothetical protein
MLSLLLCLAIKPELCFQQRFGTILIHFETSFFRGVDGRSGRCLSLIDNRDYGFFVSFCCPLGFDMRGQFNVQSTRQRTLPKMMMVSMHNTINTHVIVAVYPRDAIRTFVQTVSIGDQWRRNSRNT